MLVFNKNQQSIIRWVARVLAVIIVLFSLPFYFGYGNPIPFNNEKYSFLENLWLTIFPLMFIGLGLGWINEKLGGFIVVIPITIGFIASLAIERDVTIYMFIPLLIGCLYLFSGYNRKREQS